MKKLMKKKVSLLGKEVSVFAIVMVAMIGLVSAALVPYISNTITGTVDVNSPITLEVTGNDQGDFDADSYAIEMYGGESASVEVETTIHVDGVTGHIAENKIVGITDTDGLTVEYRVAAYPGVFQIPVCDDGTDSYFYIGDPSETLDKSTFTSTTTFNAALNLDPETDLNVQSRVIMALDAKCTPGVPVFVAD